MISNFGIYQQIFMKVSTIKFDKYPSSASRADRCGYSDGQTCKLTSATTVSQLKMCDFSGETFKSFEVL